jgi:RNA polymerase sigma factor (sigma-70 family)
LLGGKGAGLAEMTNIGLPVPGGFTITTEACAEYYRLGKKFPPGLADQVDANLTKLERVTGKQLGDANDPLLVSVRSGAARSMPGMMETVLNLGLTDMSVEGLAARTGNARFAYDAYRRFIQMYSTVVIGLPKDELEHMLHDLKHRLGIKNDPDIPADALKALCEQFKAFFEIKTGHWFPQDPKQQLWGAIGAVFGSWMAEKAETYRRVEKITKAYKQLCDVRKTLERHYKDMQDLEFTVEDEVLYMLQCRTGKRSPTATFKIAVIPTCISVSTAHTLSGRPPLRHSSMSPPPSSREPASSIDDARWFAEEVHSHDLQLKRYLRWAFPSVRGDVDDVVQESYLRVWRIRASQPIRFAKSLLFSIARHVAVDIARRARSLPVDAVGDLTALPDTQEGRETAEIAMLNEKIDLLADALATLPPRCRQITMLRKLKGVPQKTIATQLGISEKTVEEQAWRGTRRCEEVLRKRGVRGVFRK